jgi:hypothetical protein
VGKRSDFKRSKNDFYVTPYKAILPLLPHIKGIKTFDEPCAGDGSLIQHFAKCGIFCKTAYDIDPRPKDDLIVEIKQKDALTLTNCRAPVFITNPPWTREILHPLILRLSLIAPTWFLFDADWMHNVSSAPYLDQCIKIVSVGRVKWFENSGNSGKDNAAWYLFSAAHQGGPRFYPRA